MRAIQRWHLARGWATIGYHFVVSPSGRIFRGRPVDRLGAHVLGHNAGTVGICLMGNFETERPTPAALRSLDTTCRRLVPGGSSVPLLGHRDHRGHRAPRARAATSLATWRKRRAASRRLPLELPERPASVLAPPT